MNTKRWKRKLQILEQLDSQTEMLSENSFGLFFYTAGKFPQVFLKPLNEAFSSEVVQLNQGMLINFERDLIEEDDEEYALDVMHLFNNSNRMVFADNPFEFALITKTIYLLQQEYIKTGCSYIMLKTILKVLLLHLIRVNNDQYLLQELSQKRIYEFLKLMETHYLSQTEVSFYTLEMGISDKRLNQILKDKLDRTAKQIIQQRQITEAKRLLIRSALTIKEIGFELGFNSLSSFSRFFKKSVGESPSTYRNTHLS